MQIGFSHVAKGVATGIGIALCGVETWLNAEHIAHIEGWASSLVAATIIASIGAAASLPLAERAGKTGQPAKAWGLVMFFLLMAGFSFTASVARVGGKHDGEVTATRSSNERVTLAQEAYKDAKQVVQEECGKLRGSRCRRAETALSEARKALQTAPTQAVEDSMARRIAAVLPISEERIQIFQPLLLPLGLQTGGFILLALGLSPAKPEPDIVIDMKPPVEAAPTKLPSEAKALSWIIQRIRSEPNKRSPPVRILASELGMSTATLSNWMRRWAEQGKLSKIGRKYSLPTRAKLKLVS